MSDERDEPDPLDPRAAHPDWERVPAEVRYAALLAQGARVVVLDAEGVSEGMLYVDPRIFAE
jgi:hypothetical protein